LKIGPVHLASFIFDLGIPNYLRFKVCRRRKDDEEVVLDLLCLALCFAISILIESEPQWILG